ncbi:MAG: dihydroorotate dehydrogenase [Candidatus Sungbacteria bacterium]|nr:dihydroorotate dehydrogenase [Candidatus Sungbacteria bacterium]
MSTLTIGTFELEHPIMNAAGPRCKTLEEIEELARSPIAAIMVGSVTWEKRSGNSGQTYYSDGSMSLNSLGLPNGGWEYYQKHLSEMIDVAHNAGKPLIMSAAGFSPQEYTHLVELGVSHGVDGVELNLGCPNVWTGGAQKRIMCFNPQDVGFILGLVRSTLARMIVPRSFEVWIKLSPFSDPVALYEIVNVIRKEFTLFRNLDVQCGITVVNTFANAFLYDKNGYPAIQSPEVKQGLAGMSGAFMKGIGLGHVIQIRDILGDDAERIKIIGVGGVRRGTDVSDYERAGASIVQVGTAHADRGPRVFSDLLEEYVELSKGPQSAAKKEGV